MEEDGEAETRKIARMKELEAMVKKLTAENEQLLTQMKKDQPEDNGDSVDMTTSSMVEDDSSPPSLDVVPPGNDSDNDILPMSDNEMEDDTWLYFSPYKPPTVDQKSITPIKWLSEMRAKRQKNYNETFEDLKKTLDYTMDEAEKITSGPSRDQSSSSNRSKQSSQTLSCPSPSGSDSSIGRASPVNNNPSLRMTNKSRSSPMKSKLGGPLMRRSNEALNHIQREKTPPILPQPLGIPTARRRSPMKYEAQRAERVWKSSQTESEGDVGLSDVENEMEATNNGIMEGDPPINDTPINDNGDTPINDDGDTPNNDDDDDLPQSGLKRKGTFTKDKPKPQINVRTTDRDSPASDRTWEGSPVDREPLKWPPKSTSPSSEDDSCRLTSSPSSPRGSPNMTRQQVPSRSPGSSPFLRGQIRVPSPGIRMSPLQQQKRASMGDMSKLSYSGSPSNTSPRITPSTQLRPPSPRTSANRRSLGPPLTNQPITTSDEVSPQNVRNNHNGAPRGRLVSPNAVRGGLTPPGQRGRGPSPQRGGLRSPQRGGGVPSPQRGGLQSPRGGLQSPRSVQKDNVSSPPNGEPPKRRGLSGPRSTRGLASRGGVSRPQPQPRKQVEDNSWLDDCF